MKLNLYPSEFFASYRYPFFILLFLCFASAILGDSIAEALLLSRYNASIIPKMYMVNALFLFLFSFFILSFIDKVNRGKFFHFFLILHCSLIVLFWTATKFELKFLYIPLFSYSYITKVFIFLLFWTLANDIVDSRTAGKVFPFIAAGGTLGAIIISFTIPWILRIIITENLLLVWIGLLLFLIVFFTPVRISFGSNFESRVDNIKQKTFSLKKLVHDLKLIGKEPLLSNMSILYFLVFFIILNQQYVFYDAIKIKFQEASKIAGFLGFFNGISMGMTFLIQISIAGFIIKKIGSTRSMFFLPAALSVVFFIQFFLSLSIKNPDTHIFLTTIFWGIVAGVGLRLAFFDSFFSPNFQIFFSSLPKDVRGRGKLAIEGIVKPFAMVIASLWILFIAVKLSFTGNMIILFFICCLMIFQTFRIKSKYAESLMNYLSSFRSKHSILNTQKLSNDRVILELLSNKLTHESFDVTCYIIEILAQINTNESINILINHMKKCDNKTVATIIMSLAKKKNDLIKPVLISMLSNQDSRVVANCILALATYDDTRVKSQLISFLQHPNSRIKANTIIVLWSSSDRSMRSHMVLILREMLMSTDLSNSYSALYVIYQINDSYSMTPLILSFFERNQKCLIYDRKMWHHFLKTIGRLCIKDLILVILEYASIVNKKRRNDIVVCLRDACKNGFPIKSLFNVFKLKNCIIRGIVLKTIRMVKLPITKELETVLLTIADQETSDAAYHLQSCKYLKSYKANEAVELLYHAVKEEFVQNHFNNLLQIAVTLDKSGRIENVLPRLSHENRHVRARALEIFDNTGNIKINRMVIQLIDKIDKCENDINSLSGSTPISDKLLLELTDMYTKTQNKWVQDCAKYVRSMFNYQIKI